MKSLYIRAIVAVIMFLAFAMPVICLANNDFDGLRAAIEKNNIEKLGQLLNGGADPNSRNKSGDVPLYFAALKGRTDMAGLLISKGADVNARNSEGWTALMTAVTNGNIEMVKYLMDNGADPSLEANLKDAGKRTVFTIAKMRKRNDIIAVLSKSDQAEKNKTMEKYLQPTTQKSINAYNYMQALRTVDGILKAWFIRDQDIKKYFSRKMLVDKSFDDFIIDFVGVSNPHNEAYEITGGRKTGDKSFEFDVNLYYLYNNDPESSGMKSGKIKVVEENDVWYVDGWGF